MKRFRWIPPGSAAGSPPEPKTEPATCTGRRPRRRPHAYRLGSVGAAANDVRSRLSDLQERLHPDVVRNEVISSLEEMFRSGTTPDPPPQGFHPGRALTSTLTGLVDGLGRRLGDVYMPWLGKSFDAERREGINVLLPSARIPMKVLWPRYEPEPTGSGRMNAFRFRTYVAPGAVDPGLDVLKIDYDLDPNPSFIIRDILDEIVQVEEGLYLGKVLYRREPGFRRIGFFTLQS